MNQQCHRKSHSTHTPRLPQNCSPDKGCREPCSHDPVQKFGRWEVQVAHHAPFCAFCDYERGELRSQDQNCLTAAGQPVTGSAETHRQAHPPLLIPFKITSCRHHFCLSVWHFTEDSQRWKQDAARFLQCCSESTLSVRRWLTLETTSFRSICHLATPGVLSNIWTITNQRGNYGTDSSFPAPTNMFLSCVATDNHHHKDTKTILADKLPVCWPAPRLYLQSFMQTVEQKQHTSNILVVKQGKLTTAKVRPSV